jgi:hypothetical protein
MPEVLFTLIEQLYGAPWLNPDPVERQKNMSTEEMTKVFETIPPGVISRHRSSNFNPVQVPDLIGVKDRHYLDRTGLQQHHSIGDLMRYAALNQGGDLLANFDGFIAADIPEFKKLPGPQGSGEGSGPLQRRTALCCGALYLLAQTSSQPKQV